MTAEQLAQALQDLDHDVSTCGFNSFGIKASTYHNWRQRIHELAKAANKLAEQNKNPAPPPPPPVTV